MSSSVFYFIHGYPDDAQTWNALIENLGTPESLRFDLHAGPRPQTNADVIALHLENLKPLLAANKKIVLVAHDLGVPQAWSLLPYLGDHVRAMIVFGGFSIPQFRRRLTNPEQLKRSWYMGIFFTPLLSSLAVSVGEKFFLKALKKSGWTGERKNLKDFFLYRLLVDVSQKPARTRVPVLHISGTKDPFLLPVTTGEMEAVALNFETEITPGGHWLQLEKPEWLAKRIEEFLVKR